MKNDVLKNYFNFKIVLYRYNAITYEPITKGKLYFNNEKSFKKACKKFFSLKSKFRFRAYEKINDEWSLMMSY